MNLKIFVTVTLLGVGIIVNGKLVQQQFDKVIIYEAMASSSVEKVDAGLNAIKDASLKDQEAYEGALLMKKAGLVGNPKNKLNLFKSGRNKLEKAIINDSTNAEWRFLRFIIQEHAPKFLNYRRNLEKDSQFVGKFFKSLSPVVQQAVTDYSKNSKVLNPALLN